MGSTPNHAQPSRDEFARGERRTLLRVLAFGVPLFVLGLCLMPNVGPVLRIFSVPATSMAPGLNVGSIAFVSRWSYGLSRYSFDAFELPIRGRLPALSPARGDVVVLRLPRDPATFYIKRVIGLPGDTVQMRDGRLVLNRKLVEREPAGSLADPFGEKGAVAAFVEHLAVGVGYTVIETDADAGFLDNTAEFLVPAGHLFVMGDNRDNSTDSRIPESVGFIPIELVLGRVVAQL